MEVIEMNNVIIFTKILYNRSNKKRVNSVRYKVFTIQEKVGLQIR